MFDFPEIPKVLRNKKRLLPLDLHRLCVLLMMFKYRTCCVSLFYLKH